MCRGRRGCGCKSVHLALHKYERMFRKQGKREIQLFLKGEKEDVSIGPISIPRD